MKPTFLSRFFSALNELSNAELARRTGLHELTQKLLYHGTKAGVKAGGVAQRAQRNVVSRFQPRKGLTADEELTRSKQAPGSFDLTLTEEQQMVQEMLQRFALEVMRPLAAEAEQESWEPLPFLERSQELALNLIAIPEALGGAGGERSPVSHTLMAEVLSYGDMGLALAMLSPLGVINALTEFGSGEQQARYLPAFVDDVVPASTAIVEPRARFSVGAMETRAIKEGRGYRLNGIKSMVPLGMQAELFLVCAELEGEGPRAFLVEASTPGIETQPDFAMGLQNAALGTLTLDDVWVEDAQLLGEQEARYDHQKLLDLSRVGLSAMAVGTAHAVLDYVIPYCNERIAFGEPISHRQAVAFSIADMAIELEGMRMLVWRAAGRAEHGLTFQKEAYLARLQAAEKGMMIGSQGVQMLGGAGFVCDHPVERWYRQLRAIAILEGAFVV
jgi:alkylation response protein AidB-like acyl-CoA dehydrogenase